MTDERTDSDDERAARRVPGEDAPLWLAGGLAALGASFAVGASLLALDAPPAPRPAAVVEKPARATPGLPSLRASRPAEAPVKAPPAAPIAPPPARSAPESARTEQCLPIVAIAFPYNSARPDLDGARERVEPLLAWLAAHPGATLSVEGHTDPKGGEAYNVVLSFSRARAVVAWLARIGVAKERMAPLAAGASPPKSGAPVVADNRTALLQVEGVAACQSQGAEKK